MLIIAAAEDLYCCLHKDFWRIVMSEKSLQLFGNVCTSCITVALVVMAAVSAATLLWVMYLQ
ncbi:MAG: hypothetical protein DIZ78_00250 [endosymbiont of Escarpia spicata]|uniref:Uncharacterized protein n=1 Tax=endosymbiont of Escarpia spicata TaxID=2200908 RepID=A0A370DTC6_9GAMM|nr:MAG: hypothetical protein DIZ78_00250 [endosymbiont of Escarpia spicata]